MSYYIVFDGRARDDVDRASVLECIGEVPLIMALREFNGWWADRDGVLFEYDIEGDNRLVNGRQVFTDQPPEVD